MTPSQKARLDMMMANNDLSAPFNLVGYGKNEVGVSTQVQNLAISFVERQLSYSGRTLRHVNRKGAGTHKMEMIFTRSLYTLPELSVTILKWQMLSDLLGLNWNLTAGASGSARDYDNYIYQSYTGILHGDNGATVQFKVLSDTLPDKAYFKDVKENCLYRYTPEYQDIVNEFVESIGEFTREINDNSPVCHYARRLAGGGASGGWATGR